MPHPVVSIAATVVCAVALVGLVLAERAEHTRGRYLTKPVASAAFIVLAAARGALGDGDYGTWIFAGLVLGAVGDVALMFPSDRAFLGGLVAFLLGHVAYVVALAMVTPVVSWVGLLAVVPIVAAAIVVRWLWPHLGDMRLPVLAYVVVITAMAIGALAAQTSARQLLDERHATWLTLGALLFFASDIAVARDRFVSKGLSNRLWGLPAYYAGQCLIAWSVS